MRSRTVLLNGLTIILTLFTLSSFAAERVRGIYITQTTLETTPMITYLIDRAKASGINTFVIDFDRPSNQTNKNIQLVRNAGLKYVARIVVFPNGGTPEQVRSEAYWEKKYRLAEQAIELGADAIQLDYIRFKPTQAPSPQNAKDIYQVISWFKQKLSPQGVGLQIDVFGIASFGSSNYIGQDIRVFANAIDALCPMVYPSHYEPYQYHSSRPYQTVYTSLSSISQQMNDNMPFKLIPFIEMYNFRYPVATADKPKYIYSQIKATEDAGTDGWYAWSANNKYDSLFETLKEYQVE